jgi:hypothetical protein
MAGATKKRLSSKFKKCGLDGCTNKAHSRNRCQSHLIKIWDAIEAGDYTEDDAIARGLLAPRLKTGRPRSKRSAKSRQK